MQSKRMVKVYYVEFDRKDNPKEANYYKFESTLNIEVEYAYLAKKDSVVYRIQKISTFGNWAGRDYAPLKRYLSNDLLNGKSIFSPRARFESINLNGNGTIIDGKFYPIKLISSYPYISIKLLNINKDFYENQVSIEKTDQFGGGNPFVEPVQIYSNVKNGLGCFGAFNRTTYTTQIK